MKRALNLPGKAVPLLVAFLLVLFAAGSALAAGLAEEHTVLYYLLENQRRYIKDCQGQPMSAAPSLTPSQNLRDAATDLARGKLLSTFLSEQGLEPNQVFTTTLAGATPQAAFDALKEQYCPNIMGQSYKYVGAYSNGSRWVVLLSAVDARPVEGTAAPSEDEEGSEPGSEPVYVPERIIQAPAAPQVGSEALAAPTPPPASVPAATVPATEPGPAPRVGAVPGEAAAPEVLAQPAVPAPQAAAPAEGDEPAKTREEMMKNLGPGYAPSELDAAPSVPTQNIQLRPEDVSEMDSLFVQINQVRSQGYLCGAKFKPAVPPLKRNPTLNAAAAKHAQAMVKDNFFSSTTPQGVKLGDRITAEGYAWKALVEHLAQISPPAGRVMTLWLGDERKCSDLMDPQYKDAGIGFTPEKNIFVLILAAPSAASAAP